MSAPPTIPAAATPTDPERGQTAQTDLIWRQIHWQRPLAPDGCLSFLRHLASDQRSPLVVLEARSHGGQDITYLLGTKPAATDQVSASLTGLALGTTLTTPAIRRTRVQRSLQLRLSTRHRALRTDTPDVTARVVLHALAAVRPGETLVLQVVLGPRRIPLAVPTSSPSSVVAPWWYILWHGNGGTIDSEKRTALRTKVSDHGYACAVRLGVRAATAQRRQHLLLGLLAALRTTEASGVGMRAGSLSTTQLDRGCRPTWRWPLRLGIPEVVALTGWPIGDGELPGHGALHPRKLPPVAGTATTGRIVAASTAPGQTTNAHLRLSARDALHHTHVIGPTGVGKSVLLGRLIAQDMAEGRAVTVIEPKGDLVADVLEHVPEQRRDDIVILDPSDPTPVGLNPLAVPGQLPEVVADGVLTVFKALYADAWGPRTQDILHASLLTLARRPDASLVMLPLLLTNTGFRRSVLQGLRDPIALGPFWAWYDGLSDAERAAVIAPVMNKLRPWLLHPGLRGVLGQRAPKFSVCEVFTKKRILLVPLQGGVIGQEAARLLGSLAVAQVWQTALSRTAIPPERRHPVMVYIDEVQDYLRLPTDLGEALAQARGLGVGFTLAHQFLGQLPPEMRAAILANARSRICFQLSHEDAVVASKGHPELSPDDFTALPKYEIYASLFAHGQANPYASGRTLAPEPATSSAAELRTASRERYGQDRTVIEDGFHTLADHAAAISPGSGATGFGRKVRTAGEA